MNILKIALAILLITVAVAAVLLYKADIPAEIVDARYSNPASRFLEVPDGPRIHYRDEGQKDGPVIVLLHGSNASLHTWEPWVSKLGDNYRVVTLDLPGHGLTGRVPRDDYSMDAFVDAINAVLDQLDIDTFVLGGNSMGGGATWQYTLRYQERVKAMILIDASGLPEWWQQAQNKSRDTARPPMAFALLSQPWFRSIARYLDPWLLVKQGLQSAYNNAPVVNDKLINRYYELSIREGSRDATLARFSSFNRGTGQTFDLKSITQPTLIMWGAKDSLIPVSTADKFHEALPNSSIVIYDNLGHVPMEEDPTRTAADARKFLQSLESPSP